MKTHINNIEILEPYIINGVQQWVLVKGSKITNPLILFLHGGPGFSQISFASAFQKKLEEYFLVVNWDQRGAGKSFIEFDKNNLPTMNDYITDLNTLITILLKKFNKKKLVLVGHSWGSLLGTLYCSKYPSSISALICCGYGVNFQECERVSMEYLKSKAEKEKNEIVLHELKKYKNGINQANFFDYIKFKSKWISRYGGYFYTSYFKLLLKALPYFLSLKYYSIIDFRHWINGIRNGQLIALKVLLNSNLFEQAPQIDVPMYFFIGRHDFHTPWEMTKKYFDTVKTTYKEWVWFENSAHSPNFEESDCFSNAIINKIIKPPSLR